MQGAGYVETWVREHEKFTGEANVFDDQVTTMANLVDWRLTVGGEDGEPVLGKPRGKRHKPRRR
jgi:hypothetical protein